MLGAPGPVTHRQLLVWEAWWELEMSRPTRSDFYAMQTAMMVNRVGAMFSKNAQSYGMDKFRLNFDSRHQPSQSAVYASAEEASRVAVAVWVSRVGGKVRGLPGVASSPGRPASLPAPLRGRGLKTVAAHEHLRLQDKRAELLALPPAEGDER